MKAFNANGLSFIATKLGEPKMLHSYTSAMCVDSCCRNGFAHALNELDATFEFKDELVAAIPRLKGSGYTRETIWVVVDKDNLSSLSFNMSQGCGNTSKYGNGSCPSTSNEGNKHNTVLGNGSDLNTFKGGKDGNASGTTYVSVNTSKPTNGSSRPVVKPKSSILLDSTRFMKLDKARELHEPSIMKLELDSKIYSSSSSSSSTRLDRFNFEYFTSRSRVTREFSRLIYTPTLEEDNGNSLDDLVDDTTKKVEAPPGRLQAEQELLQTTRDFHSCKQEEGQSVISLGKTINELHAMLKLHEQTLPKNNAPALHAIRAGHWKMKCLQYLAELLKKKKNAASGAGGSAPQSGIPLQRCDFEGVTDWYQSTGYRELCRFQNMDYNHFSKKFKSLSPLSDIHARILPGYSKETMGYSFYYPPENKVLVARNDEFLENSFITQEASGSLEDLEIIQEEDTHPSIDTSLYHEEDDLEIDEPKSDIISIRRSTRTRHAPDRMCLYIDVEEHELGDLGEHDNYKAALLDPESEKWLNAMNVEMQSMKDNEKFGFTQNRDEPCIYLKASGSNITFLILYVDDILIMGNNIPMLQGVKSYLERCFAMKDLGEVAYILGIKIYRDRSRQLISLCQSVYIEKILKRYCMEKSKRGSIPMQEKLKLSKSQGASTPAELKRMQNVPYASANTGDLHWTTIKNIIKYLRNTKVMFLVYEGDLKRELRVSCYADVGYLTDADDLKSQTGYMFVLNGGAVDWKSANQSIFATSSAEVEYITAFDASKEAVWVRKFISGLGVVPTIEEPINDNLADPFTKALAFPKHSEHTRNIGMLSASSLM
nr:hypothetical protein [Tanacetum cinerariifolium]